MIKSQQKIKKAVTLADVMARPKPEPEKKEVKKKRNKHKK